jgi:hypothetical protein
MKVPVFLGCDAVESLDCVPNIHGVISQKIKIFKSSEFKKNTALKLKYGLLVVRNGISTRSCKYTDVT